LWITSGIVCFAFVDGLLSSSIYLLQVAIIYKHADKNFGCTQTYPELYLKAAKAGAIGRDGECGISQYPSRTDLIKPNLQFSC
jgi:hypothetical protein